MALMITGGTGFLGAYVTRHAARQRPNEQVIVFDRYPLASRVADLGEQVRIVDGDMMEIHELLAAMKTYSVDRLIHLAFSPGSPRSDRILPYLRTQCIGTASVFEAARIHGIRRVITASSVAVYGYSNGGDESLSEESVLMPQEIYGSCKVWAEQVAALYNEQHGMQIISLRISASMGHGRINRASLAAGLTAERFNWMATPELAALGEPVTMPPQDQPFDFIYAADTAAAFWAALSTTCPNYRAYNVLSTRQRVGEMADALRAVLPAAVIAHADKPFSRLPLMSNDRLRSDLGFVPQYTLAEGVREYVATVQRELRERTPS